MKNSYSLSTYNNSFSLIYIYIRIIFNKNKNEQPEIFSELQ